MGAELDIFIDLQARRIVPGMASSGPVDLAFYQDDTYHIVLHGLLADDAAPLGTIYSPAPISYTAVAAGLFAGGADAPPTDGTWKVKFAGDTTPALRWNVGKGELATALNALGTVTMAGGVKVLESGPGHFYTIQWQAETPVAQLEVVENELSPVCLPRIRTNPAVEGQVLIKLVRVPLAFTDEFELPLPPPVTIEPVRAGTTQRNEIQAVVIPDAAAGEFALTFNGTASQVVPVAEASAVEIQRVLNELYADAVQRFAVTNPSRGRFYVEFVGPLAKTDQPLLAVEMFSQTPLPTPKLSLPITAEVPVDLELLARDRIPIIFEIAAWNGAEKTVLAHQAVSLVNNAIDSGLAEELEQSGAVMTRTNTVYIDNTEATPIVIAAPGAVFTPAEAAEELVIEHSLNTFHPDVRVHYEVSTEPEEWIEVPDDQYEATATTANHVTVIGLPLSADPEDEYYFGRWKIFVASPDAKVKILEHSHPTTEVFEGAKTLAVILDELRAALPTGWPNIPANKLTGPILATQIDINGVAEALRGSSKFVTTLREVLKDATIVSTLATELRTNAEFADTIKTLLASESVIEALVLSLKDSATYHDFVRETVYDVLQGSGGVLPDGSVLFSVPSFEIAVPAPKTIPAPSQKVEIISDVEVQTDNSDVAGTAEFNASKSGTLRVIKTKERSVSFNARETLVYDLLSPTVRIAPLNFAVMTGSSEPTILFVAIDAGNPVNATALAGDIVVDPLGNEATLTTANYGFPTPGEITLVTSTALTISVGQTLRIKKNAATAVTGNLATTADPIQYVAGGTVHARTEGPRRGRSFKTGTKLTRQNGHWYEVRVHGFNLYPVEMEHAVLRVEASERMWKEDTSFAAQWVVAAALLGNAAGAIDIVVELGERDGAAFDWTEVARVTLPLTDTIAFHQFEFIADRTEVSTTGMFKVYGEEESVDVSDYTTGGFTLRVRTANFDCELPADGARGCLQLKVPSPNVSITPIEISE